MDVEGKEEDKGSNKKQFKMKGNSPHELLVKIKVGQKEKDKNDEIREDKEEKLQDEEQIDKIMSQSYDDTMSLPMHNMIQLR